MLYCPRCLRDNVYPSRLRLSDLLAALLFRRPYRCYSCSERFNAPFWARKPRASQAG
jgi:transposase-like protein